MATIGSTPPLTGGNYTPGPGGNAPVANAGGTANPYRGQGAGTVNQVANGYQNFVQGGNQLMGNPQQGDAVGGGGQEGGGSIAPMPAFKSPIMEKAKNQPPPETQKGEGRDSTGWKKLPSIFDGDEGGGEGGGGEE